MRTNLIVAIVIEAVVLVAAFGLSLAYIFFGVDHENLVINIALIILWVFVAGLLLLVFWWRSLTREEMVRRFFLSNEWIYNHEIGYAPIRKIAPNGDAYGFVTFAADSLAKMSYGFEVADAPEEFHPQFLIASSVFRYHFIGGDEEMGEKPDGVVVDQWCGSLQRIEGTEGEADEEPNYEEVGKFENARELARLIEDNCDLSAAEAEEGE